ncbi:ankyrin repeat-containing domain protein [Lasiosphaeria hispida]|uniref:Ankyrin repeat-containing domain protein n=1 Tax=Lasiosphaeria hispida TaxID=260671 RepID=A0AAJ0HW50_9PEZI|nr:ankyrin repeat-containing domain protein [Lasiosphaeria hispida]
MSEIRVDPHHTARDIELFIDNRIQHSRKLRHSSVNVDIKRSLLHRAENMFLYVRLMLDELESEVSVAAVRHRLEQFPATLDEYYAAAFNRINNSTESAREFARDLLTWITTSHEPIFADTLLIALKTQSLSRTAFANASSGTVDELELLDPVNQIRSICFPLVEVTDSGIIQLVHCSVASYVRNHRMNAMSPLVPSLILTPPQANQELALACIFFLRFGRNHSNLRSKASSRSKVDTLRFVNYAVDYWPEHLSQSNSGIFLQNPALYQALRSEELWFSEWVQQRLERDYTLRKMLDGVTEKNAPRCLQIAVYFGVISWAGKILHDDLGGISLHAPTVVAASRGSLDVLQLLHRKATVLGVWHPSRGFWLHAASRNGHAAIVRYLVDDAGCEIDLIDSFGRSALMIACSRGRSAVAEELLKRGADTSLSSPAGFTAVEDAASVGDLSSLVLLLNSGGRVTGNCLWLASANGHAAIISHLLQSAELDPGLGDENGWTPLHWACRNGHFEGVLVLLAHGVAVDALDSAGRTPLNRASGAGHPEIVDALLRAGASPVTRDSAKMSPAHLAASIGSDKVLDCLFTGGVDLDTGDLLRKMPFPKASWKRRNDMTPSGPPLHLAAENGHSHTVTYLIEHGADIDKQDSHGQTALFKACSTGREDTVSVLLAAGANDDVHNYKAGHFPLTIAVKNVDFGIISALAPRAWSKQVGLDQPKYRTYYHSPIINAIHTAAECQSWKILEALFSHVPQGFPPSTAVGLHAFEAVFQSGNVSMAEFLERQGFDLSQKVFSLYQSFLTPLGQAIEGNHLPLIRFLLDRKVNPGDFEPSENIVVTSNIYTTNRPSENSLTALDMAALVGSLEILDLLIERQSRPPDPGNNLETWPFIIDRPSLLARLTYFADVRQGMRSDSKARRPRFSSSSCLEEDADANCEDAGNVTWAAESTWQSVKPETSALCAAIVKNDLEEVKRQLDGGADVNELDWKYDTPLITAITTESISPAIIAELLQSGANVNFKPVHGASLLAIAGNVSCVEVTALLLGTGASRKGLTLERACLQADLKLLKVLLDAGVDPNARQGYIPALCCIFHRHDAEFGREAIPLLLASGTELSDTAYQGQTALHLSVEEGWTWALRPLIEAGSPINGLDNLGLAAVHRACLRGRDEAGKECFDELIRLGASIMPLGEGGISALHMASSVGCHVIVEQLVQLGGKSCVDWRDGNGSTPLMWAAIATERSKTLIGLKLWRPNMSVLSKKPPPHVGIETVCLLLHHGANIHLKDHQARTVMHWAADANTPNIITTLLENGAEVDVADNDRRTPLNLAIIGGAVECVRLLLGAGANPNAIDHAPTEGVGCQHLRGLEKAVADRFSQSMSLHLLFGKPETNRLIMIARLLIDAGANVFGRNFYGETCLHVAVKQGNIEAVTELIYANNFGPAYLEVKDNGGRTAKQLAEHFGFLEVAKVLEKAEAKGYAVVSSYTGMTVMPGV